MKKQYFLASVATCLISAASFAYDTSSIERSAEMQTYLPSENENLTFADEPLAFLEAIQLDHHFRNYQRGLDRTSQWLEVISSLYAENPEASAHEKLDNISAKQLYGILLTFEGMFYQQLALDNIELNPDAEPQSQENARKQAIDYMIKAGDALTKAVEVLPDSPEAHFQLGKYYRDQSAGRSTEQAEQAFYKAGELSLALDNKTGFDQAKTALIEINIESPYLTKLIEMEEGS